MTTQVVLKYICFMMPVFLHSLTILLQIKPQHSRVGKLSAEESEIMKEGLVSEEELILWYLLYLLFFGFKYYIDWSTNTTLSVWCVRGLCLTHRSVSMSSLISFWDLIIADLSWLPPFREITAWYIDKTRADDHETSTWSFTP